MKTIFWSLLLLLGQSNRIHNEQKRKKGSKHQEQRQCDQQKEKKLSRKIGLIIKHPKKLVIFMSMDMQFQFLIRIFRLILIQINRKLII